MLLSVNSDKESMVLIGDRLRVLIVEDDALLRDIIASNLELEFGFSPITAEDAHQAFEILEESEFQVDAILLDHMLPGMNGLEFFRQLRQGEGRFIPVVMMTGTASTTLAVEFMKSGGSDFVQKPIVDFSVLDVVLRHAMGNADAREQLRRAEAEKLAAEEARRMMEDFVAKMSHELGTPAHHISSAHALIKKGLARHDLETANDWLATATKSTDRLKRLIGDVIDLSRIRRGKMALRKRPANISEIARNAIHEIGVRFPEVKSRMVNEARSAEVFCDPDRITQVFVNLLSNAARHAPESEKITLRARVAKGLVRCSVTDKGGGIPAQSLERIFAPFFQGDDAYNASGTLGLGLTISREIVVLHDGAIWAESDAAEGTRFIFEIPSH